jgi:LPS-assembly lipoprotein
MKMSACVRILRLSGVLAMIGLLSACGWQLQGVHRVPEYVAPLYLELTDIHSAFADSLRQRLTQAGVAVTEDRKTAQAVLRVSVDSSNHRVSSVSAFNEPQQYDVYYDIEYSLDTVSATATNLLPRQAASSSRTMSYDKTLALAKQREETFLRETLAAELADQLMRRLGMLPQQLVLAVPVIVAPAADPR